MGRPKGSGPNFSNQTERKFIKVATDLFSRNGFKGTSIRDIAREMEMTTANLYHHFGTKEGLLFAVEQSTILPIMEELKRVSSLDLPPMDRLNLLMKTHLTYMGTHQKESKIFFLDQGTSPLDKTNFKKNAQAEIFSIYRREIKRLLSGAGKKGNPSIAALSVFGIMNWFINWYHPEGPLSMQAVIQYLIDFALYGLIGEGSGSRALQGNKKVQPKTDKKEKEAERKRKRRH